MASSKEMQIISVSRPLTHRPSASSVSASGIALARQAYSRNNSHSVVGTALNGNHRVTRWKSVTSTAANMVAVAAALEEVSDQAMPLPISIGSRRNTISKNGLSRSAVVVALPSPPASLPTQKFMAPDGTTNTVESAIEDDSNGVSAEEDSLNKSQQPRVRRASDEQPPVKEGRKSNRPEIRCETCGKGYKHSSCLTKHLWEHTPEWAYTSKLLISKHQQVQLLEAASVLVAMHKPEESALTLPDFTRDFSSERDSVSPVASGYSDQQDRSSADTTPSPGSEISNAHHAWTKMPGNRGGRISRLYISAPLNCSIAESVSISSLSGHVHQLSQGHRPTSSGKGHRPTSSGRNASGQDDHELAAAVEMLSCSYVSNHGTQTTRAPGDAPQVPPFPIKYIDQASLTDAGFLNSFPTGAPESFTRGELCRKDIKMEDSGESVVGDDEDIMHSQFCSDEDDDGVFGRMEE